MLFTIKVLIDSANNLTLCMLVHLVSMLFVVYFTLQIIKELS